MTVAEPLPAWFPFTAIRHEEAPCPLHLDMKTINEWQPSGRLAKDLSKGIRGFVS